MRTRLAVVTNLAAAMLLTAAPHASAGDFHLLVRRIESRYSVRLHGMPCGWLTSLIMSVARPEGVLDVRLATLSGENATRLAARDDLIGTIQSALDPVWHPMIHARSRRNGTMVSIYARARGSTYSLLIVNFDADAGSIVELSLRPERFLQWIVDPLNTASRSPA
jgi:hypothetical protein